MAASAAAEPCAAFSWLRLSTPYVLFGAITGAWISIATVERTAVERIGVAIVWPMGGLIAVTLVRRLATPRSVRCCALLGAVAGLSAIVASGLGLVIAALLVTAMSQSLFGLRRAAIPRDLLIRLGPSGMLGGLVGVGLYTALSAWSVIVLLGFFYFARSTPNEHSPTVTQHGWPLTRRATLISGASGAVVYGTIPLAVAITVDMAGRGWVVPQMAAYAGGALLAGRVDRLLPEHQTTLGVLITVAAASWFAAAAGGPGIVAARFTSGALLFVTQGRLEAAGSETGADNQSANLTAVKASIGIGAMASALWVGTAYDHGITAVATVGALAGVALTLALLADSTARTGQS